MKRLLFFKKIGTVIAGGLTILALFAFSSCATVTLPKLETAGDSIVTWKKHNTFSCHAVYAGFYEDDVVVSSVNSHDKDYFITTYKPYFQNGAIYQDFSIKDVPPGGVVPGFNIDVNFAVNGTSVQNSWEIKIDDYNPADHIDNIDFEVTKSDDYTIMSSPIPAPLSSYDAITVIQWYRYDSIHPDETDTPQNRIKTDLVYEAHEIADTLSHIPNVSSIDDGWKMTFKMYYNEQTGVIDNMHVSVSALIYVLRVIKININYNIDIYKYELFGAFTSSDTENGSRKDDNGHIITGNFLSLMPISIDSHYNYSLESSNKTLVPWFSEEYWWNRYGYIGLMVHDQVNYGLYFKTYVLSKVGKINRLQFKWDDPIYKPVFTNTLSPGNMNYFKDNFLVTDTMFNHDHVPYIKPSEHDNCIGDSLKSINIYYDSETKYVTLSYLQIFIESKFELDDNGDPTFWAPMNPCFYAKTTSHDDDYSVYYSSDKLIYNN